MKKGLLLGAASVQMAHVPAFCPAGLQQPSCFEGLCPDVKNSTQPRSTSDSDSASPRNGALAQIPLLDEKHFWACCQVIYNA